MAGKVISIDKIKGFVQSQFQEPEKRDLNVKLLRAIGIFAGSIIIMRQYGDLMAI